jgi:hypothetical protein
MALVRPRWLVWSRSGGLARMMHQPRRPVRAGTPDVAGAARLRPAGVHRSTARREHRRVIASKTCHQLARVAQTRAFGVTSNGCCQWVAMAERSKRAERRGISVEEFARARRHLPAEPRAGAARGRRGHRSCAATRPGRERRGDYRRPSAPEAVAGRLAGGAIRIATGGTSNQLPGRPPRSTMAARETGRRRNEQAR